MIASTPIGDRDGNDYLEASMQENVRYRSIVNVPRAFAWQAFVRPGMFERLTPPWQHLETVRTSGTVQPGDIREMRLHAGPLALTWLAVHERYEEGYLFSDRQVKGPFTFWRHRHHFREAGPERCELEDELSFELPLSAISHPLGMGIARAELRRMFGYRHFTTFHDLTTLYQLRAASMRVGLSGEPEEFRRQLAGLLGIGGHTVVESSENAAEPVDAVVRLAQPQPGRVTAEVERPGGASAGRQTVESAMVVSPDSTLTRLARALQFFDPAEGTSPTAIAWTTVDDFIVAVYRCLKGEYRRPRTVVRHAAEVTLSEYVEACSGSGMVMRLGAPPRAVLDQVLAAFEQAQLQAIDDQADVETRSRYRSIAEAFQVRAGQF